MLMRLRGLLFASMRSSVVAFFFLSLAHAQPAVTDRWYDETVGYFNTGLINGEEYRFSFRGAFSHPFFLSDRGTLGEVNYDSQHYSGIRLLFDIYSEQVVVQWVPGDGMTRSMKLDTSRLDWFKIESYLFRRINGLYYEELYKGETVSLYARHVKSTYVDLGHVEFREQVDYLMYQDGKFAPLKAKSDFLKRAPRPDELKVFMKNRKVRWSYRTPSYLAELIRQVDEQLTVARP